MVSKDRIYSSFSGLPKVLLALLLVLRFPGEKATELPDSSVKLRFCKDLFRFLAVVTARMFP